MSDPSDKLIIEAAPTKSIDELLGIVNVVKKDEVTGEKKQISRWKANRIKELRHKGLKQIQTIKKEVTEEFAKVPEDKPIIIPKLPPKEPLPASPSPTQPKEVSETGKLARQIANDPRLTEAEKKAILIEMYIKKKRLMNQLKAQIYVRSLYQFDTEVLGIDKGQASVPLSQAHKDMCQFIDEDKQKFKLLLFPRGHLKSTLVTVGHVTRRICQNPKVRILIANATYGLACTFLDQVKAHLKGNKRLHELYGDFSKGAEKWSESQIKVFRPGETVDYETKEPTVTAMGVTGSLTSQHYDMIIGDDLVNRENITTLDQIKKVRKFYQDALDLLEPGGEFILIGTRWHDVDLYGWIMDGDSEKPPEIPKSISKEIMPYQFVYKGQNFNIMKRKIIEGKDPIWPEKFTMKHIQMLKQQKGPYEFSAQYNNEPVADEDQKFKREWFRYYIEDDLRGRNMHTYTMIDPAISQDENADYTVITTIAVDEARNWFVREIIREHMLPHQLISELFNVYERWHPIVMGIETVAFQKMLVMNLNEMMHEKHRYLPIKELKPDQNRKKEARILALQPGYYNGKLYHKEHGLNLDYLEDELLRFPRGTHDDIIDTLAYLTTFATPPTPNSRKAEGHHHRHGGYLY